ncbi:MAG: SLC13 family permease [Anaerolineales bacterium]|nr:SLC13 family permease [Anaerolineales bacterium]
MIITFIILAITILLFIFGKWRSDLVAVMSLLALFLFGILNVSETLAGFSNSTVIMIGALFIVGEGLSRTGVTKWISDQIINLAGSSKTRLIVVLMLGTGLLSAFISNTGTVATLLPAVVAAAWQVGSLPSKFLIPLAFSANTGGMLTLTGTPLNIIVADTLSAAGYAPFGYFEFALIGAPLLAAAIIFMVTLGQRLLPQHKTTEKPVDLEKAVSELADSFHLHNKLARLQISPDSKLVGKTLAEAALGRDYGLTVLRIDEPPVEHVNPLGQSAKLVRQSLHEEELPGPKTILQAAEILLVKANPRAIENMAQRYGLQPLTLETDDAELADVLLSHEIGLAEVLITPRSAYNGQTILDSRFSEKYNVQVVSIRQGNKIVPRRGKRMAFGDVLLVRGDWEAIELLRNESRNFVVLGSPDDISRQVVEISPQSIIAVVALIGMVVLMVTGVVPAVIATMIAAAVMILGRCMNMEQAYRAINWQSVVLLAAMIPMSTALAVTGGAQLLADSLVNTLGVIGPMALMAGVFLLTTAFSQVISNTATTVLVAPIVLQSAEVLGISPYPLMMTVVVAASAAFLTPIASPTNTMVMTPGGYAFKDYIKVGLPLVLLFFVLSMLIIPIFWPF